MEVQVNRVEGKITAVGRGNMIDERTRGPPAPLAYKALDPGEATVLRAFFGSSILKSIGNGEGEAPVRYACDPERCRAAFRYGETLVTLLWVPSAVRPPPHQVVDQAASHLGAWSQLEPHAPSITSRAMREARADAGKARRAGDLRPVAYLAADPEGGKAWIVDGFGCSAGHRNFRRMHARIQDNLGDDVHGYVLAYNGIITRRLRCHASQVGASGKAFRAASGDEGAIGKPEPQAGP